GATPPTAQGAKLVLHPKWSKPVRVVAGAVGVGKPPGSQFAEQLIDDPTTADVWPRTAQVAEERRVGTTGFFQRVRQDRQVVERPFVVDRGGDLRHRLGPPDGIEDDGAEGVAEQIKQDCVLFGRFDELVLFRYISASVSSSAPRACEGRI